MEQIAKISWSERLNHVLANHKDLLYIIGILVVTVISFWPTFFNDFQMQWDDQWQVTNHFTNGQYGMNGLVVSFKEGYMGQYSPLNQLIYSILFKIGGYNPALFHAMCLLFHLGNVTCIYYLLRRILFDCTSLSVHQIKVIVLVSSILYLRMWFWLHRLNMQWPQWCRNRLQ